MLNPLPNIVNTYSMSSRATVQSLIRDMKVDKTELQNTVSRMSSFSAGSAFAAGRISPFSVLDRQIFIELFRESYFRVQNFFSAMNSVGLAINSMVSVLGAEIEKVEKDIENLELFINNYEFVSGKDDLYNFNYLERFTDMLGEYRVDGSNFLVPDRDNTYFSAGGNGFVNSSIGAFKFGSAMNMINVLQKIATVTVSTNYDNYISSNSDPMNLFNDNFMDSWNVTVKSPTILTSNLTQYAAYIPYDITVYNGAQAVIDATFKEGIAMDTIKFAPNSGNDFQVMQVVLFPDAGTTTVSLLDQPVTLRSIKEISFPKKVVNRVILILNQPSYTRSKPTPITSELNSKIVNAFVEERVTERRNRFSRFQDMVYWYFLSKTQYSQLAKNRTEYDFYNNRFPIEQDKFANIISDEIFASSNFGIDYRYEATRSPALIRLIENAFRNLARDSKLIKSSSYIEGYNSTSLSQRLLDGAGFLYSGKSTDYYDLKEQFYNYPIITGGVSSAVQAMLVNESQDVYEYLFSLKSVEFGETVSGQTDKACFVSKKIPTNAQVAALKAKVDSVDSAKAPELTDYELKSLVSYELSISTKEVPDSEFDWYPIAFNDKNQIESEVVFFDTSDRSAQLRFNPVPDSIFLYRDGKEIGNFRYEINSNKIYLTNVALYSPGSIFCVKYDLDIVQYKPHELDFIKLNLLKEAVRTYGDASGSGQKFSKTDMNNSVSLDYVPYVNQIFASGSTYSSTVGTVFVGDTTGYSPVKVQLNDGSYAVNLSNYTGRAQLVQFYATNTVTFIQTGKNIVFNQNIRSPFTVYYDYIPNSLRFRFIMRKNIPNLDAPAKIDNVLLKMKTLNFDPFYDKLNLSTAGR